MRLSRESDTGVPKAIPLLDWPCGCGHPPVCPVKITRVVLGVGLVSKDTGNGQTGDG